MIGRYACVVGCAGVFLLATPRTVQGPPPPLPEGQGSCKLNLTQAPQKPKPNECWNAVASWYGPHFEGQLTADGTIFNMYAATAAHKSLPLGSIVRVSNPETGRSMVVVINDRGPYVRGRGLDVSYEVARLLGFANQGVCRVKIQFLRLPANTWLSTRARD
jgi:rare lipoprotein A